MSLIYVISKFFVHALALKFSAGALGASSLKNTYGRALKLSGAFVLLHFLLGFVPLIGGLLYLTAWCALVMKTYKFSLLKSVGVALLQGVLGWVLLWVLKAIGLLPSAATGLF